MCDHHLTPPDKKEPHQYDCPVCDGTGIDQSADGEIEDGNKCASCDGSGIREISAEEYEEQCLDEKADLDHDDI